MNNKFWLLAMTSTLAICTADFALAQSDQAATTQADSAANSDGVEEITVTARRREEKLQVVPTAITAFSAKDLAVHSVTGVEDIGLLTPSLTFSTSTYGSLGGFVAIRGQRPNDLIIDSTPSVGLYIDDVYQSSTLGLRAIDLNDAASVEVLKGPQGTLYGRNTTGGAIKIDTPLPNYFDFSGNVKAGFGNEADRRASGSVNIPLVDGKVALRLAGNYETNDGYGKDLTNGQPIGSLDMWSARLALRWAITDDLEAIVRADYTDARGGGSAYTLTSVQPAGALTTMAAFTLGYPLTPAGFAAANRYLYAHYVDEAGYDRSMNGPSASRVKQDTESVVLQYDLNDDLKFKTISAFMHVQDSTGGDLDGTPFSVVDGEFEVQKTQQFTEEVQAIGNAFDDQLNYTAGYYYYNYHGDEDGVANVLYPLIGEIIENHAQISDISNSGYAQATYKILPELRLTAGARYTNEQNPLISHNMISQRGVQICNIPTADLINGQCIARFGNTKANKSYTIGLDYDITDAVMVYAKTSRGFKSGGVNEHGNAAGGFDSFAPEQVTDYEVGAKSEFWDHRVRLNVALFDSEYKDIQRSILVQGAAGSPATAIQNAASATIKGIEAELTVKPMSALTLTASASYLYPHYNKYFDALSGADLSGDVFADVPKWQGSISGTYVYPTPVGPLTGTVDVSFQTKVNFSPDENQKPTPAFPLGTGPFTSQGGYALLNARLSLLLDQSDTTISVWGRNLTNERYFAGGEDQTATTGFTYMLLAQPRTFGVEISKSF